jgi:uncharacterized protein YecT (DUF1311 family)
MIRIAAPAIAIAMMLPLAGCGGGSDGPAGGDKTVSKADLAAEQDRIRRGCASEVTYQRLKELAFDEARRIASGSRPDIDRLNLDRLATASVLRMEQPLVKSRDEKLNVTVCRGRLILELPPGVEGAFGGQRRLVADVEYAAQAAADGSGLVYQMDGAEPIVYRLANFDPRRAASASASPAPRIETPAEPPAATAVAEVAQDDAPPPAPVREPIRPRRNDDSYEAERSRRVVVREVEEERTPVEVAHVARPSFNCRFARSRVEKMICSDDQLAALDRRMATSFYAALAATQGRERAELQRSRNAFVTDRDSCRSAECVADSYHARISELRDYR